MGIRWHLKMWWIGVKFFFERELPIIVSMLFQAAFGFGVLFGLVMLGSLIMRWFR